MIDYDFDHIPVMDPMDRVSDAVMFAAIRIATGSMPAPLDLDDCAAGYRLHHDSSDGGIP